MTRVGPYFPYFLSLLHFPTYSPYRKPEQSSWEEITTEDLECEIINL